MTFDGLVGLHVIKLTLHFLILLHYAISVYASNFFSITFRQLNVSHSQLVLYYNSNIGGGICTITYSRPLPTSICVHCNKVTYSILHICICIPNQKPIFNYTQVGFFKREHTTTYYIGNY